MFSSRVNRFSNSVIYIIYMLRIFIYKFFIFLNESKIGEIYYYHMFVSIFFLFRFLLFLHGLDIRLQLFLFFI